jgi:hypothetical protein
MLSLLLLHAVALASAGFLIANHVRLGGASLISRVFRRAFGNEPDQTSASAKRKLALTAAEARRAKVRILHLCTPQRPDVFNGWTAGFEKG